MNNNLNNELNSNKEVTRMSTKEKLSAIIPFDLTEYNDNWKYFSKPYYHFENKQYQGGLTTVIESNPKKILDFIRQLKEKPSYLKYVKSVTIRYSVGNEYRGWGGNVSEIELDKEFAEKIKIRGVFRWIDKGWGDYYGELSYDLSSLEELED